jgi:hypothetical protein
MLVCVMWKLRCIQTVLCSRMLKFWLEPCCDGHLEPHVTHGVAYYMFFLTKSIYKYYVWNAVLDSLGVWNKIQDSPLNLFPTLPIILIAICWVSRRYHGGLGLNKHMVLCQIPKSFTNSSDNLLLRTYASLNVCKNLVCVKYCATLYSTALQVNLSRPLSMYNLSCTN